MVQIDQDTACQLANLVMTLREILPTANILDNPDVDMTGPEIAEYIEDMCQVIIDLVQPCFDE